MTAASPVRRLRRLRRAERTCWSVLIGPLCAAPVTGASVMTSGDDPLSVPAAVGGTAFLAVLVLLVVFLLPLVHEWRADSLSGREADEAPHPVDWSAKGWVRVRDAFHSAGLDTARLDAVSTWSPVADLKVVHVPQPSPGRLGRMEDWGTRLQRRTSLWAIGAAAGLGFAFLKDRMSPPFDGDRLLVPAVILVVALWAVAGTFLYHALTLNVRRPAVHVAIPRSWRTLLRSPAGAVLLRHEISHLRHGDPMRRRYLRHLPAAGKAAVCFDGVTALAITPIESPAQTLASMAAFALTLTGGLYANSRARRVLPTLMEMRADAEAVTDRESADLLSGFLTRQQEKNPTRQKADRLLALSRGWTGGHCAPYARTVAAAWVFAAGACLPALGIWTGVLDGVSA
ncbi:hypothetical protein GTZ89_35445 [Streptomyces sp. SID8382]|uniref:hypothetical protein n=1 Tax=Streptomyces malaysiensis TaxID=92644 RepID=UPI000C2CD6BF|nr:MULTISPECIES: hypothetical protein [unclassified Streptomyces]AUA08977.1 hypothetical protein CFP59_01065 [Streptomyces sp. M56]MYX60795.1 hypothetical protein [Streptomyces sp. SID8382]